MANVNAPFGLRPVRMANGQTYTGSVRKYSVPASDGSAIYIGDLVKLNGTSQIINGISYPDAIIAATGDVFLGPVVGVEADTRDSLIYRAASTQRVLYVADDPNLLFEIQQGNSGTALNANDVGLNANVSVVAGSTVTGYSGSVIDNATEATTNTLDLKIVDVVNRVDNDIGSSVSSGTLASRLLVRINRHQYSNQVAGA
jgi:hypothetical protein